MVKENKIEKFKQLAKEKNYDITFITTEIYRQKDNVIFKCNKCGSINEKCFNNLRIAACSYCGVSPKKVNEVNSIRTKAPWMVELLKNKEDADKYTSMSNRKIWWKCPSCGAEKEAAIDCIKRQGIGCSSCSDKNSVPNKLLYWILKQINIEFETEKMFDWGNRTRYDIYLPKEETIIELHGIQHYEERNGFTRRGLQEQQKDDKDKRNLAFEKGIKEYIEINCKKSSYDFLKNNIIEKLNHIIDFKKIDFDEAYLKSQKSIFIEICKDWTTENYTIVELGKKYKLTVKSIRESLKRGTVTGICYYNGKEEMKKKNLSIGIKIEKINRNKSVKKYNSIKEAAIDCKVGEHIISRYLKNKKDDAENIWIRIGQDAEK